jgi:hypothetical protein
VLLVCCKIPGSILDDVIGFFTMVMGSTQPVTEMSTSDVAGGKGRPTHKADNLTAICEPIV